MHKELTRIREVRNYYSELKWTELTSPHKLPVYLDFVNVFFDDKFSRFVLRRVVKGHAWQKFGKTNEERFFKAYHHFIKRWVGPFSRYYIYADEMPLQKKYRWRTFHFLINKSRRNTWALPRRNISQFTPTDSSKEDLLQLTDILLGALTSLAEKQPQPDFRAHTLSRRDGKTQSGRPKIIDEVWTPQVNMRNSDRTFSRD